MTKNNKILVIVLILILLIVGVYFSKKPNDQVTLNNQTATTTNSSSTTTPTSTQNTPAYTITAVQISQGTSTIVKDNWGIVVTKDNDWKTLTNDDNQMVLEHIAGHIGDRITISYIKGYDITDTDPKFGSVKFYWDNGTNKWMMNVTKANGATKTGENAKVVLYRNPPVFLGISSYRTYIIPLSHTAFVKLNVVGSGDTSELDNIVNSLTVIHSPK